MISALKTLFKNSVVYGIANSIQKLTPVIVIPIITRHLGKEALKVYDVAFIYTYLFCAIILLSLDTAASVFYFDKQKQNFDKKQVLSYSFYIQILSLVFNFILIFSFHNSIADKLFEADLSIKKYWLVAMWFIPGYMLFNYGLNVLLWQSRRGLYLTLCVLNTLISVSGSLIAIFIFKGTILNIFYVQIGSVSTCGLLAIFFLRKDIFNWPFPINDMLLQKLFLFGVPFALTSFFRQLIPSIDRYFLLRYHFSDQLPYYILAVKIASFFTVATNAFVLAFTPYSLNKLNQEDAESEISELFHLISILAFISIPVILLFRNELILLFANESYNVAAKLLPFLFMGWVFDLFTYFSMLGIYKSQNAGVVLLLLIIGTVIISGFNMLLVPRFGIYGAAASFFITKFLMFFVSLFYLRKYFRLKVYASSFLIVLILACIYSYLIFLVKLNLYFGLLLILLGAVFFHLKKIFEHYNLREIFKLNK